MRIALFLILSVGGCSGAAPSPSTAEPAEDDPAPTTGALCGTRGAASCPTGTFCDFAAGASCGADDRGGRCALVPDVCTQQDMPACGCDGQTYPSACTAHSHAVAVAHDGPC